nr:hypothetical protein [Tanacetum cinerariifolium]
PRIPHAGRHFWQQRQWLHPGQLVPAGRRAARGAGAGGKLENEPSC